jgi:dolichyl-phosphate beta-glucosyltransferase
MQDTIIVVPCYNEAARFDAQSFAAAASADPELGFVFVDDGSKDQTRALLTSLARERPGQFRVLGLERNVGKAEAVRRGVEAALEPAPRLVGYLDADLATPLAELPAMRALFSSQPELLLVLGSRVSMLGKDVVRSHRRHYLGRIFASLASALLGLSVYDTQCGAKLFRNTPAVRGLFSQPFKVGWTFDVEILARLTRLASAGSIAPLSRSALEHPLSSWRDVRGSKLTSAAALEAGTELAKLWALYGRHGSRRG